MTEIPDQRAEEGKEEKERERKNEENIEKGIGFDTGIGYGIVLDGLAPAPPTTAEAETPVTAT